MATTISPSTLAEPLQRWAALGRELWHRSAPKAVVQHCQAGSPGEGWDAWVAHLSDRKKPAPLAKLLPSGDWPLTWALPTDLPEAATTWLAQLAPRKKGGDDPAVIDTLESWLADAAEALPSPAVGLEAVAVAHALPRLAGQLAPELWWELLEYLVRTAHEATVQLDSEPLTSQLLTGELPLTLAYLFPELQPCRDLAAVARQNLSAGPTGLLDGEGLPHARNWALALPLMALWTRCITLGRKCKEGAPNREAVEQYEWLVRNAIRFTRHDGTPLLSPLESRFEADLWAAALELGGDEDDQAAATMTLPGAKPKQIKQAQEEVIHEPATNSEWAGLALLRPNWSKMGPRLAVDYATPQLRLELNSGAGTILLGEWAAEVKIGGKTLKPAGNWEELCWNSDDDVDYLELEIALSEKVRLQRQILFAREDQFLYLCDLVLGAKRERIEYCGSLPLAVGSSFAPADETREGFLTYGKSVGLVLPLALPEWRSDPRQGSLAMVGDQLQLKQQAEGQNLACPLFIDLHSRRMEKDVTWRQLTVAEKQQIVPRDMAIGYRIQCGKEQWMLYRSLGPQGNRTLLGQNLTSEFLFARFDTNGDAESMLEIE